MKIVMWTTSEQVSKYRIMKIGAFVTMLWKDLHYINIQNNCTASVIGSD